MFHVSPVEEHDVHVVDETFTCPCGPSVEDIPWDYGEGKIGTARALVHRCMGRL